MADSAEGFDEDRVFGLGDCPQIEHDPIVLDTGDDRRVERDQRAIVSILEKGNLDLQQQKDLLQHAFEQARNRRGLKTPTDG
mgnify:CR=1 FL=1